MLLVLGSVEGVGEAGGGGGTSEEGAKERMSNRADSERERGSVGAVRGTKGALTPPPQPFT